jgi:anti-anti-sigma regulatory factor
MRVTIHPVGEEGVIMKIEGKLAGPNVPALSEAWEDLGPTLRERALFLDVRGLTHVDETGRSLLAEIHAKTGAEFQADTPLTKHFAEEATGSRTTNKPSDKLRSQS